MRGPRAKGESRAVGYRLAHSLPDLWAQGLPAWAIAERLGTTVATVYNQAHRMKLPPRGNKNAVRPRPTED